MWYRDLAEQLENAFDLNGEQCANVLAACAGAYAVGSRGMPIAAVSSTSHDVEDFVPFVPFVPESVRRDVAELVRDAWLEGVQRKDRLAVALDSRTDGVCGTCGRSVTYEAGKCTCGSADIFRQVSVTVSGPFAEIWADNDQTIDGEAWESVGNGDVYTVLSDHPGLVAELRAEGYRLDLTNYDN